MDRLITGCGLRGIFSVELKRDANSGIAKVLEVNARPWWYVHYATACGVNVCEMTYRAALGAGSRRRTVATASAEPVSTCGRTGAPAVICAARDGCRCCPVCQTGSAAST